MDARDRLLKGYNQRWALIMISSEVTKARKFGRDEKATDTLLQEFIARLAPQIHRDPPQAANFAANR